MKITKKQQALIDNALQKIKNNPSGVKSSWFNGDLNLYNYFLMNQTSLLQGNKKEIKTYNNYSKKVVIENPLFKNFLIYWVKYLNTKDEKYADKANDYFNDLVDLYDLNDEQIEEIKWHILKEEKPKLIESKQINVTENEETSQVEN